MTVYDVLIVGAGHGGTQAAITLRQLKFEGSIALVGDEPDLPYERPPLSKEYLAGDRAFERILIRPAAFWNDRQIAMRLGSAVVAVDPVRKDVTLGSGERLGYRHLIWATGGTARRLSCDGHDLAQVHSIRRRADVDLLLRQLPGAERIVVIGGGYIGLEAAAALSKMAKNVCILEAADRVLARVAAEPVSRFFEEEHRRHGVEVRTGVTVGCIDQAGGAAVVRLADSRSIEADLVIVGVGIVPAVEPLIAVGAEGSSGVDVDAHCRTSLPDVFAIGDCASHENAWAEGARVRVESVQNATDQAQTVARFITGDSRAYTAMPWFWSNQYDLRLQTAGLSTGYDDVIVRGDPAARSFSAIYCRGGKVVAVDAINAVKDYVQAKPLIERTAAPPRSSLADTSIALKDLVGT
jgi:3-phenylpropionate/trans-cinnamate dioxygenase ferredoxin reductase subunit